jgi:hypothetical protein
MEKQTEKKQEIKIQRFTMDNVLTTKELSTMSKKNLHKHIEYLEQVALGLDNALLIAIEQLNVKLRAKDGTLI